MNMNTRLCLIKSRGDAVEATPRTSEKVFAIPPLTLPAKLTAKQLTIAWAGFPQKPSLVFFKFFFTLPLLSHPDGDVQID